MRWLAEHPGLLIPCIVLCVATLVAFPILLIPLAVAPLLWWGQQWYDRRTQAHAAHRLLLAAHADYEHWLTTIGHPAGVYGRYPPAC